MRDVPERHRSLRAAIDQSWRLLTDEQRSVFSRLSVFRGSFDRSAAVAVTGADLRLLSELVGKSLLRRPDSAASSCTSCCGSTRPSSCADSPAEEADARARHGRHYAAMLVERKAALIGPELAAARDELRGELDNLRAAAEWSVAEDDEHAALEVLEALNVVPLDAQLVRSGRDARAARATAGFDAADPASADAVALAAAMYSVAIGDRLGYEPAAEELAARCLPVLRARKLERELALCLSALGLMAVYRDVTPKRRRTSKRERRSREPPATGSPRAGPWSI